MASGKEEKVEEIKASEIVNELRQLRSGVDSFLNKFERFLKLDSEQKSAKIEGTAQIIYIGINLRN